MHSGHLSPAPFQRSGKAARDRPRPASIASRGEEALPRATLPTVRAHRHHLTAVKLKEMLPSGSI
jgi:hypothetical protein